MEIYSVLSILAAAIYLEAGIYVLMLNRRALLNIVYSLGCFLLFFYSICYFFYFRAGTPEEALFALRIGSVGWIMIIPVAFHFTLLISRNRQATKWWLLSAIYVPFLALLISSLTGFYYTNELVRVNGIYFPVVRAFSAWHLVYGFLLILVVVFSAASVASWAGKISSVREKRQLRALALSFLVSFPFIVLNSFILIPMKIYLVPDLSHVFSLINIVGAMIAVVKYRVMKPSSSFFNDDVLSSIEDFLILLDGEGKIAKLNRRAVDVLGYREEDMYGKPAGLILIDEEGAVTDSGRLPDELQVRQAEIHLLTRDGEKFPVQATVLPVRDRDTGTNGLVIIGHDRTDERALGQETRKRMLAEASEKKQIDYLHFLSNSAMNFIELRDDDNIYHLIGQKVRELSDDALNIIVSWNDYMKQFQVETTYGNQSYVSMIHDILGGNMEKVFLRLDPEAVAFLGTGKFLHYSRSFYELVSGMIPEKKCERIENELGLSDIGLMGFTRGGKLLGGLILFSHTGAKQVNRVVLEGFVHQASIAIQRKRAEEQLATSETIYRRLMETVFEAVVIHKEGKIVYMNEKASIMLNLKTPADSIGRSIFDFVHPDSKEEVKARSRDMYTHGVTVPLIEEKFVTSDGKAVDVEVTAAGFIFLDSPAVLVVARDIGYRKKLEAEMRDMQRQIEFILGVTKTGLDIIDSEMRIVYIDPEWKRKYGEPEGKKCYEYFLDRKKICDDCDLVKAMKTKETLVHEEELAKENRWVQVTTIPYQSQNGAWFYAEVNVDITERKKIEKEYMTACSEIEKLNLKLESEYDSEQKKSKMKDYIIINQSRLAAMSEMLQNISHHWKEPLNNIGLLIQNIRSAYDGGKLDAARMEEFGNKGIDLLYGMTRTLDDFGNFLKTDKVKQRFCLREAVDKAVALANVGFREADIRIIIDVDENQYARGYLNETVQIIVNLLNNSREAVVENGIVNAFVRIVSFQEGDSVVLTVTDNGGGIPADILPHLFEPYYTAKKNSAGIGLYLSREFVEKDMDGKMTLTNVNDGVEVRIRFPRPK